LFVLLAILGFGCFGGSVLVWTVLKAFSGSAHLLAFLFARGAHRSAFENNAPAAAWGLWTMPLAAALLVLTAIGGAATSSVRRRAPRAQDASYPESRVPDLSPAPARARTDVGEIEQPPPAWR
jgi:hypothetical protein